MSDKVFFVQAYDHDSYTWYNLGWYVSLKTAQLYISMVAMRVYPEYYRFRIVQYDNPAVVDSVERELD